jgi:DNA-directed RNA polymerase subunit M/transcription elongation factor TFIIS
MAYQPESGEVFYGGKCDRTQETSQGEKCVVCGGRTVSFYQNREKFEDAHRKWQQSWG